MLNHPEFEQARACLLEHVKPIETEIAPLIDCAGRILAEDFIADRNVPPFDRTPYDGYAFRAADLETAAKDSPVTLRILEEIPAGGISHFTVTPGTAVKVLTGASIPEGADTVEQFEVTQFTKETVTFFAPVKKGRNVVYAGEDVKVGDPLALGGVAIDAGTAGTLAAQGVTTPRVFRKLRVAVLSTGSELVEPWEEPGEGMIRNANAYTLCTALRENGFQPVYLGIAKDTVEAVAKQIEKGLTECDAVISTGGVSVGDYDLTPAAMDLCGIETLVRGVKLKPGAACSYGVKNGRLMCGLSGNPASCMINLYTVALPALRKMAGWRNYLPELIDITMKKGFSKASNGTRVLRGKLTFASGRVEIDTSERQGNVMLSATVGSDAIVVIPGGSGPVEAGTVVKGFLV